VTVDLSALVSYLDDYLRIGDVNDSPQALNGLQVANGGTVERLAATVDACRATIERAAEQHADFLLVHHGLFWSGLQPLTGPYGERVRSLIRHDIALYAAHLPLDVHPDVGNNAVLARMLGLEDQRWFGQYEGQPIGIAGTAAMPRDELAERIGEMLGTEPQVIATGPERVRRIGVVTGGGGKLVAQAAAAGIDTYVTGEGPHHAYFDAEELGVNLILAGHYATETVGVKALAEHLAQRFGLPWEFIDHPTGL
jgi:dinuclear metal center YbgI/SA1388 family protein